MNVNTVLKAWAGPVSTLLLVWGALIYLLEPTASSMMSVWNSSETYAHGYVILPISLWLVWRKRHDVMSTPCRQDFWALIPAVGMAAIWLAGRVVGAQVVEHYALVGLMMISVWAIFGRQLVWVLLFPLFYLLLMVPAGDSLIEPMIHFTANFTVGALRLLGIPVMQEGTFLELPSGEWSVVEACSGIRYFLSSVVLGWLYAYLTYRTGWKRALFGVASIIVPVFANGVRATIIVLLGHYSDMTLAVGVDHIIYGWVWFGIVMLAMFWVGGHWREDVSEAPPSISETMGSTRPAYAVAISLILLVSIFPTIERQIADVPALPSPLAQWVVPDTWKVMEKPLTNWRPHWRGMDDERVLHLQKGNAQVMVYLGWYGAQRQNAELINSQNVLVHEKDPVWRDLIQTYKTVALSEKPLAVAQGLLNSPTDGQRLLAWYWYHIDGDDGINSFVGKLRLAWSKLSGRGDAACGVIVAAPYSEKPEEAEPVLKAFLNEIQPSLNKTLNAGRGRS